MKLYWCIHIEAGIGIHTSQKASSLQLLKYISLKYSNKYLCKTAFSFPFTFYINLATILGTHLSRVSNLF